MMRRPASLILAGLVATTLFILARQKDIFFATSLQLQELNPVLTTKGFTLVNYRCPSNDTKKNENTEEKDLDIEKITASESSPASISETPNNHTEISFTSKTEESAKCNYTQGRWVKDKSRPLYSGFRCKQWLTPKWACRLGERPNFSYEKYRWQPGKCQMPNFDRFSFLKGMQDQTIAFVGDSMGRQQFVSLMCMATAGDYSPEVIDVSKKYSFVRAPGTLEINFKAYRFRNTNTTILFYWSATLSDLVPYNASDPNTKVAMHLDRPPAFLREHIGQFNVLIVNTGHHWTTNKVNKNRWVFHVNGKRKGNRAMKLHDLARARNFTVHSITKWLDSEILSNSNLRVFFRTFSPRHFLSGEWNSGGSCDNVTPLTGGNAVDQEKSSDELVEGALKGSKVKILDITALSDLRNDGHVSRYSLGRTQGVNDCSHWCLPGIPDTWNELLVAQL